MFDLPPLRWAKLEFTYIVSNNCVPPRFMYSVFWRSLRTSMPCLLKDGECENCAWKPDCGKFDFFSGESRVKPFALEIERPQLRFIKAGERFKVSAIVIGSAISDTKLISLVMGFDRAGLSGFGRDLDDRWRVPFVLEKVEADNLIEDGIAGGGKGKKMLLFDRSSGSKSLEVPTMYSEQLRSEKYPGETCVIQFKSPTQLVKCGPGGKKRFIRKPEFVDFFRNLTRRAMALSFLYCGEKQYERTYFPPCEVKDHPVTLSEESSLKWKNVASREDEKYWLQGFVGTMKLSGDLTPFMPLLRLGEVIGVGKNTTMGFGRYTVTPF